MTDLANDNETVQAGVSASTDANGQAAILLIESLIHGLIGRAVLRVEDAIDIVDTARDVVGEIAGEDDRDRAAQSANTILDGIAASLSHDRAETDI